MYTLLLMTAMSTAPEAAEFNGFFRDLFSMNGCHGSCTGSCYGSCSGRTSGCYGSSSSSCFGSRFRSLFTSSCYGSCSGRSTGCSGSCHGSCYGSCQGSGYGCTGGFAPVPMGFDASLPAGVMAPGFDGVMPATPLPAIPPTSVPEDRKRISLTAPAGGDRATVIVRLPSDAKLFAEGRQLALTSSERTFVSPPLQTGPEYTYLFRVEYVRDGETIARTKQVAVKAGGTVTVEFLDGVAKAEPARKAEPAPAKPTAAPKVPTIPSVGDRARITVKLPPGATLYVDGKKNDRTDPVREFNTPPLPAGQEFAYLMKAEIVRDGRPETTTTKVWFRAGDIVSVDLTAPAK